MDELKNIQIKCHDMVREWNKDTSTDAFNGFFKELKERVKQRSKIDKKYLNDISGDILKLDKRDFIIFKVGEQITSVDLPIKSPGDYIFPFNKVFMEHYIYQKLDDGVATCDGVLFQRKNNGTENIIVASTKWTIYSINKPFPMNKMSHLVFREKELMILDTNLTTISHEREEPENYLPHLIQSKIIELIKKLMFAIEKKEYTSYKKWTYQGYINKEIIYSYDVKSHKRHFWNDSKRFNIPKLGKEEWEKQGYLTDELVFRGSELRRDVPYKIINQYKIGEEKEKQIDNRKIEICMGRIFRKEAQLGKILHKLFPDEYIKRHDRKKLKGLELDYYLPERQLAFEYDGEQHFDKKICEEVFGSSFEDLQKRDRKKNIKCRDLGIKLIRIKYDEPLGINLIKKKLKEK